MESCARARALRRVLLDDLGARTGRASPSGLDGAREPSDMRAWLEQNLPEIPLPVFQPASFFAAYAGARRRLGVDEVRVSTSERASLGALLASPVRLVRRDDWARAALIARAFELLPETQHVPLMEELFRRGDSGERESLLRALPILSGPDRFLAVAVEASRTSVTTVFSALALNNDYPARHFPEASFEQLVLKTIFLELPATQIERLVDRVGPRLLRLLTDYERERRAAGRSVPRDLDLIRSLGARMGSDLEKGTST